MSATDGAVTIPDVSVTMPQEIACMMELPETADRLFDHIRLNARYAKKMVGATTNTHVGQTVAICGAGPSLRQYLLEPQPATDEVWACNSALPYLVDRGVRVTHGVGIDQGEGMLEDWARTFDVTYLIATSVHPKLVKHLRRHNRRLRWFNNFLGLHDPEGWTGPDICMACRHVKTGVHEGHDYVPMRYEMWLYQNLFSASCMPAYGLNVVARAIGVALYLGFDKILVYGSDCAAEKDGPPMPVEWDTDAYADWTKQIVVYADGRTAFDVYGPKGILIEAGGPDLGNHRWHTRADMLVTARHLTIIVNTTGGKVQLMGETLPGVLLNWTEDMWLARANGGLGVPNMDGKGAVTGFRMKTEAHDQ